MICSFIYVDLYDADYFDSKIQFKCYYKSWYIDPANLRVMPRKTRAYLIDMYNNTANFLLSLNLRASFDLSSIEHFTWDG